MIMAQLLPAIILLPLQVAGSRIAVRHLSSTGWTRSELVEKLTESYVPDMTMEQYTADKDGLLWTGSSWYPGAVFREGFTKRPQPQNDPGEDAHAWGEHIADSIAGNTWAYGFHATTDPRVAAQFGVQHVWRIPRPDEEAQEECGLFAKDVDNGCIQKIMNSFQRKYGCPGNNSALWKKDQGCYNAPCLRVDKMGDEDEGLEDLCPNWGYAYLVKVEGVHVRISDRKALGKNYNAEEEVFVPMEIKPEEILGAIPIYARKSDGSKRSTGLLGFSDTWDGKSGHKAITVPGVHTRSGQTVKNGIGKFIFNPGYSGGVAREEVAQELRRKGIQDDLGLAVPREEV